MSNKPSTPVEIARETFRQLALAQLPPTPEHYEATYRKIEGKVTKTQKIEADTLLAFALVEELEGMPRLGDITDRSLVSLRHAIRQQEWPRFSRMLIRHLQAHLQQQTLTTPWAVLFEALLEGLDARHMGLTQYHKRTLVKRALTQHAADPIELNEKLVALVEAWKSRDQHTVNLLGESLIEGELSPDQEGMSFDAEAWSIWQSLVSGTLERGICTLLRHYPDLLEEAEDLALESKGMQHKKSLYTIDSALHKFWLKMAIQFNEEDRIIEGLLGLLGLLLQNLGELAEDDSWMGGQVEALKTLLEGQLSMRAIYQAEATFKELVYRQSHIKHSLQQAQDNFRSMIALFVERLGKLSDSTGQYQEKMQSYMQQIDVADNIHDIRDVLSGLMGDTRTMHTDAARSRDEMELAQKEAEAAQAKVKALELELEEVSRKAREDQLTGLLNRHGLDDAIERELWRADRTLWPLCLVMLDLDNFKRLNDTLGHKTGDQALVHLANVVREVVRPSDVAGRYGGEEFVILLPNMPISEAVTLVEKLQRELTKHFFLHNNERILITFSAGVARYQIGETSHTLMDRADKAMYQAKQTGKNRVVPALDGIVSQPSDTN